MRALLVGLLLLTGPMAQSVDSNGLGMPADFQCRQACEKPNKDSAKLCYGPASAGRRDGVLFVDGERIQGTTDQSAEKFTSDDGQVGATISLDASGNPTRIEVDGTSYEKCTGFSEGSVSVHN